MQTVIQKLKDFNELVMFQHTIFSLPFIFIAMVVSADGWFGWELLFLGALAAIGARNFAMGLNRYADRTYDVQNPRTANRPSVDGRISANAILAFTVVNALLFIVVAYFVNNLAFYLSIPILAVLASYSYFKRFSELAHLVLGVSLGLAPIAGVVAVEAAIPMWSLFLSLGVLFWVAGFDLLYSLQDIDFDKEEGLFSIPSRYGAEATMFISAIFHSMTILFWLFFAFESGAGLFGWLAVVLSAVMLAYEHKLVRKDFAKIDRAFFTVNGYLGVMFFILIIVDRSIL
ncbi:MAG: menaquinone biosynthesis prenyltransferase MqnP [Campylobacterota bacterium]|nr:menaquinone biosynthesis prenyltransferase MqnP [Campylobacterota bacterium]